MRAVNLIPAEQRRGAGGVAGHSGGAAYILLGLLAVLVLVVSAYTLEKRSVADKRDQIARLDAEATASEGRATTLTSYTEFAAMRARRTETVTSLAASRFDWSHALHELARVIPPKTWLTELQGTVAPGTPLKAAITGQTSTLRGAVPVPAVEIVGCTTDQTAVARMMTRMRLIDGVTRVSLQSSAKAETSGAATAAAGDCRGGVAKSPQFALVVFFDRAAGSVPTTAPGARALTAQTPPAGATDASGPTGATP